MSKDFSAPSHSTLKLLLWYPQQIPLPTWCPLSCQFLFLWAKLLLVDVGNLPVAIFPKKNDILFHICRLNNKLLWNRSKGILLLEGKRLQRYRIHKSTKHSHIHTYVHWPVVSTWKVAWSGCDCGSLHWVIILMKLLSAYLFMTVSWHLRHRAGDI